MYMYIFGSLFGTCRLLLMPDDTKRGLAVDRLRRIEVEINRQLREVCSRRSVAKHTNKRTRPLPCALDTEPPPLWTACELGCGTAAFSRAFLSVTRGHGGFVSIDNDHAARAHVPMDYTSWLLDGLDAAFAKRPPSVLMMCSNCTSN